MTYPRRSSFAAIASHRRPDAPIEVVGLQYHSLSKLLSETLGTYCLDMRLRKSAQHQFHDLTRRCESLSNNKEASELSREELDAVVSTLSAILDQSPHLPPQYVASVHGYIGVANNLSGKYESAVASFLKALWLETSSMIHEGDRVEIGLLLHRLGISYHKCGDKEAACNLLGKALKVYELCGLPKDNSILSHAREEHDFLESELSTRKNRRAWQSTPNITRQTSLPTIQEDDDGKRRHTFSFERASKTRLSSV